jgi:Na+/melibiose symporter-like transporter
MRRLAIFVGLMLLLVIGGALTTLLTSSAGGTPLPILTQTMNPDASRSLVLPWKAEQFFLLVGFLLFNLVGIAGTLAVIVWFIDRGIKRNAQAAANSKQTSETRPTTT